MLDITFIRENPNLVKKACIDKQLDSSVVDTLLALDEKRRELLQIVEKQRAASNANADAIKSQVHAGGKPDPELIAAGKEIKTKLKELEPALSKLDEEFIELQYHIPNIPAEDVPIGPDESGNKVVKTHGEVPKLSFKPKHHHEVLADLGLLDTKRAVAIGGFRAYILKGDGLKLEQAILQYAQDLLEKAGFTMMSVPVMVNEEAMWGTGYLPWGDEDHYRTQDNQILTGTSEVALTAYHQGEVLAEKDLPITMAGISACFRREVGSYGKDTQGIVRVHTFNKVEQVVLTVADEAETRKWHEKMLGLSEQLLQDLELPYQVLLMCTGDMGSGQRKKFDIETWFPAQKKYRETHSASYFNDFQARRLNMRYQAKDGSTKFVYTLNNTMAATPRLLAAVVENYQQADGSIKVPKVLQKYLDKEVINKKVTS
jgi:seryl-tRNA synthetase